MSLTCLRNTCCLTSIILISCSTWCSHHSESLSRTSHLDILSVANISIPTAFKTLCVCVLSRSALSDPCNPMDSSPPDSSVHGNYPGKNTRVGCYALQDIVVITNLYLIDNTGNNDKLPGYGTNWRQEDYLELYFHYFNLKDRTGTSAILDSKLLALPPSLSYHSLGFISWSLALLFTIWGTRWS